MRKTVSFTLDVPDELLDNEPLLRDWLRRHARRICDHTMLALTAPPIPKPNVLDELIDLGHQDVDLNPRDPNRDNSI